MKMKIRIGSSFERALYLGELKFAIGNEINGHQNRFESINNGRIKKQMEKDEKYVLVAQFWACVTVAMYA